MVCLHSQIYPVILTLRRAQCVCLLVLLRSRGEAIFSSSWRSCRPSSYLPVGKCKRDKVRRRGNGMLNVFFKKKCSLESLLQWERSRTGSATCDLGWCADWDPLQSQRQGRMSASPACSQKSAQELRSASLHPTTQPAPEAHKHL